MSAPTEEKPILVHGPRSAEWESRTEFNFSELENHDVWYILKRDGNRIQVEEIYKYRLPEAVYDRFDVEFSSTILPYECTEGFCDFAGNLYYLFPYWSVLPEGTYYGCLYDKSKEEKRRFLFPSHCDSASDAPDFCIAIDGRPESRGVLVPVRGYFCLYNPDRNSWRQCFPREVSQVGIPDYAILNGKLYLSFRDWDGVAVPCFRLYVYDICTWECLIKTKFKKFNDLKDQKFFLVVIADCKLCYLWSANKQDESNQSTLYIARVDVCLDGNSKHVTAHSVEKVDVELGYLYDCYPYDSYSDQDEESKVKSNIIGSKGGDSYSDQDEESKVSSEGFYSYLDPDEEREVKSNVIGSQGDSFSDQDAENEVKSNITGIQGNSYTSRKRGASMGAEVGRIFRRWTSGCSRGKLMKEMEVDHEDWHEDYEERIQKLEKEVQLHEDYEERIQKLEKEVQLLRTMYSLQNKDC